MSAATARLPMSTTIGAHRLPERMALEGRALGLHVRHERAGGWFEKSHLLTVQGDERLVRIFSTWCVEALAALDSDCAEHGRDR